MERDQAQRILEKVLSFRQADHLEVSLSGDEGANTRFANNAITQNTAQKNLLLHVTAAFGQRVGRASTSRLDDDSLRDVVARAEQIARHAEPDTEYLPPVGPSEYPEIPAYDEGAARISPQHRAEAVREAAAYCDQKGLQLAGHFENGWGFYAIANSEGVFGYHRASSVDYTNTVMTSDSSGWAQAVGYALDQVQPRRAAEIAVQKALLGQHPREIPPGDYTVVLEPAAVAEFFSYLISSLDAKAAHEGRSALSGKEHTKIGVDEVHIYSDPHHPACPAAPFFGNGIPTMKVDWIEGGVLKNLAYSRYWAQHTGHPFTGFPVNFLMDGSDAPLETLIASVDRGLLVTRFWYIRYVDPMKLLLTGMTRDGLFWIEDGQIQYAVKNLRFNESPLATLTRIEMFGRPERVHGASYVPSLKIGGFTFTSGTTF